MNRLRLRSRFVDRSYTRQGKQYFKVVKGEAIFHKSRHIVNDFRLQREVTKGTNHDRMMQRKINRESQRIKISAS